MPNSDSLGLVFPPYQATFAFGQRFIDNAQSAIASLPLSGALIKSKTPGYLRPADALALYEHAYFSAGDILELGAYLGLSTTILCQAALNAKCDMRVFSVEVNPTYQHATTSAVRSLGLVSCYRPCLGDAVKVTDRLIEEGLSFGFIFVDFDHTYEAVRSFCRRLPAVLKPGGMLLFHDFNDARNNTDPSEYGVYRAVTDFLSESSDMSFLGVIGCCALIHRSGVSSYR